LRLPQGIRLAAPNVTLQERAALQCGEEAAPQHCVWNPARASLRYKGEERATGAREGVD
jgi:hypothetical protein